MHTCVRIEERATKKGKRGTPSLVASVLQADYPGKYKTQAPKDLIDLVENKLGVRVSYATAWRGKYKAINDLRGNPTKSFARLPSYLYMLERLNPRTVSRLVVDEKNQFKYVFFALGACIEGFNSMRKVIIMDGTHLKGVYEGVLLITTAQDLDHHHYPLTFAVVDGEKNASWSWFLTTLKTLIPDDPQLVLCTDRNQSIIKTVHEVYPLAIHGYCIYHLSNNVKGACSHVRKDVVAHEFKKIAGIYTEKEFRRKYIDFRRTYPQAAEYLDESVHESKWARCQFPGARTLHVEVLNTFERQYNVTGTDEKGYLVDLINKTCHCRHFEIDRYPCVHALAAIRKYCRTTTDDTLEQLVENYCSKYYWMEQWTLAYCRTIYPVPHHSSWQVPEEIQSQVVFPPSDKDDNDNDNDDIDYEESSKEGSDNEESGSERSGDEGGDNEGNDE
ncbi:PREDICTED: uncharacterized protein LOC106329873 [Brassica oleracea var. oleracea]|uniref:uncharacterized protein LOC106329873 n=1 Tax=Brassica oleracea var. oleracea TaxID=109376 RepID=UPI0006A720B7|nr:PREDICTED: uncharacterized protein LOC106329873 [Brassica oleracea var. oleracea]